MKKSKWITANLCILRGEIIWTEELESLSEEKDRAYLVRTVDEQSGEETVVFCCVRSELIRRMEEEPADGTWILLTGKLTGEVKEDHSVLWIEADDIEEIRFPEDRKPTNIMLYCGKRVFDYNMVRLSDPEHPEVLGLMEGENGLGEKPLQVWYEVPKKTVPGYAQVKEEKPFQLIGSICFSANEEGVVDGRIAEIRVTRACRPEDVVLNRLVKVVAEEKI